MQLSNAEINQWREWDEFEAGLFVHHDVVDPIITMNRKIHP